MDDKDVLKLILNGESEQVERKEQLRNKKPEVCQAICAFANDFPGPLSQVSSSSGNATTARQGDYRSRTRYSLNSLIFARTAAFCPSRRSASESLISKAPPSPW